jgi:hypothetical protein
LITPQKRQNPAKHEEDSGRRVGGEEGKMVGERGVRTDVRRKKKYLAGRQYEIGALLCQSY